MRTPVSSPYLSSRRVGEAVVSLLATGVVGPVPLLKVLGVSEAEGRHAMPETTAAGTIVLGKHALHIQIGTASLLIDPSATDPRQAPGVSVGLRTLGLQPEQITHVLLTHAHGDHFTDVTLEHGGQRVVRYTQARHVLGRLDWDDNPDRQQPDSLLNVHLGTVARQGLLDVVAGDQEIVPGVTMRATPGETPGHMIVHVHSAGQHFYFLGDLFHHACQVEHLDWRFPHQAAIPAARRRLLRAAVREDALLVFAHHHFPGWGRIVPTDAGYRWEDI